MSTLTVEDPACIGLTSDEIDAEPTPLYERAVAAEVARAHAEDQQ